MHAAHLFSNNSSKLTKIAVVTVIHVAAVMALANMKVIRDALPPVWEHPPFVEPTPPVEPEPEVVIDKAKPLEKLAIVVPETAFEVEKTETKLTTTTERKDETVDKLTKSGPGDVITDGGDKRIVTIDAPPSMGMSSACARPDYPARAAREGAEGTVTLALLINTSGQVADAKVQRTSGSRDLDRAAISALSMCTFKPATANGVPTQAWGQIAYVWTLD